MILDAGWFARGWLSVWATASTNKDRPQLYRTVHVEQYPHGLRLTATDSYMLLTAWVPERDFELDPPPDVDEVPDVTAVAMDVHGRCGTLLTHLLALSEAKDTKDIDLAFRILATTADREIMTFDGMAARAVICDHPDHERVQLDVFDGGVVDWRPLLTRFKPARTTNVALNPLLVGRIAKAAKLHDGAGPIKWWFGGADKAAQVEFGDSPAISGLVMPTRWDFDKDAPWYEPEGDGES
jgi:hypothetical protein